MKLTLYPLLALVALAHAEDNELPSSVLDALDQRPLDNLVDDDMVHNDMVNDMVDNDMVDDAVDDNDLAEPMPKAPLKVEGLRTVPYKMPRPASSPLFLDLFQSEALPLWQKLTSDKFNGAMNVEQRSSVSVEEDLGMKMSSPSAYHGRAAALTRVWDPSKEDRLFFTMEVQQETPVNCGGAYVKLFHAEGDVSAFDESTAYSIMFGPDHCGYGTNKVHFIIKWSHNGELREAHVKAPPQMRSTPIAHQYGFALSRKEGLKLYIDGRVELEAADMATLFREGDFAAPEQIVDPDDTMPEDWVGERQIPDPEAEKPEDWPEDEPEMIPDEDAVMPDGWLTDEPEFIVNEDAVKPEDWNDAEDGEWLPPRIRNPDCAVGCGKWERPLTQNPKFKGEWQPPMIDNPAYKGPWEPRQIPNPDFWKVDQPFDVVRPVNAVGIELWTVEAGTMFDNFMATTDEKEFLDFIKDTFEYKYEVEQFNQKLREKAEADKQREEEGEQGGADGSQEGWMSRNRTTLLASIGVPVFSTLYFLRSKLRSKSKAEKAEDETVADEKKTVQTTARKPSSTDGHKTPDQPDRSAPAESSAPTTAKDDDEPAPKKAESKKAEAKKAEAKKAEPKRAEPKRADSKDLSSKDSKSSKKDE